MQSFTFKQPLSLLALTIASFLYTANSALANEGEWYLRANTGLSLMDDTRGQSQSVGSIDGSTKVELDDGFFAGMAVGYRYGPNWAAEISWDYRSNDSETTLADGTEFIDGNYASNIFYLNGLYHFTARESWEPYVGAGVGWIEEIDIDLENAGGEISYSGNGDFGLQVFAGVNYLIDDNWAINGEVRYGDFDDIDLDGEAGATGKIESLDYAPSTLQIGALYRF